MFSIITSLIGGPIVGIVGSLLSNVVSYFEKKQAMEADAMRFAHERGLLADQLKARGQELESEEAIAETAAAAKALAGSYSHDKGYGETGPVLNGVLRCVRPALTIFLLAMVAWMLVAKTPGIELQAVALKILFLAEVAVSWWFASRIRK